MKRTILRSTMLCCLLLAVSAPIGCGGRSEATRGTFGAGKFESLTFSTTYALNFCLKPEQPLTYAEITRAADGSLRLAKGWRAKEGDAATADCDPQAIHFDCLVRTDVNEVALSAQQAAELERLVAAVPDKKCDRDSSLACDLCLATSITVDALSESGECCGELNDDFRTAYGAVVDALNRIASTTP